MGIASPVRFRMLALADVLVFLASYHIMASDTLDGFVHALCDNRDIDAVFGSFEARTPAARFFSKFENLRHH